MRIRLPVEPALRTVRSASVAPALALAVTACGPAAPEADAPAFPSTWRYGADPDAVTANNGMVVSTDEYASQVGVEILQAGGNAIDAAIAVQFALAVVNPEAGNIGRCIHSL